MICNRPITLLKCFSKTFLASTWRTFASNFLPTTTFTAGWQCLSRFCEMVLAYLEERIDGIFVRNFHHLLKSHFFIKVDFSSVTELDHSTYGRQSGIVDVKRSSPLSQHVRGFQHLAEGGRFAGLRILPAIKEVRTGWVGHQFWIGAISKIMASVANRKLCKSLSVTRSVNLFKHCGLIQQRHGHFHPLHTVLDEDMLSGSFTRLMIRGDDIGRHYKILNMPGWRST